MVTSDSMKNVASHLITPQKASSKFVASHTNPLVASYLGVGKSGSTKTSASDADVNHDTYDHCDGSTFCSSSASDKSPPSLVEEEDTEDTLTPLHPTHSKSSRRPSYRAEDDDEDDEEMIQYNYNSEYTPSNFKTGSASLRRTPGANAMHRSAFSKHSTPIISLGSMGAAGNRDVLRRTPGASVMHRSATGTNTRKTDTTSLSEGKSAETNASPDICTLPLDRDSALENKNTLISDNSNVTKLRKGNNNCTRILGYGLATPSPLVSRGQLRKTSDHTEILGETNEHSNNIKMNEKPRAQDDDFSTSPTKMEIACTPTPQSTRIVQSSSVKSRPPLDPNSTTGRENYLYTPAEVSLANNRDLNLHATANGAMSPNTIQLATSLDNLLDDEEGNLKRCDKKESKGQTDLPKDSSFHRFTRTSSCTSKEGSTNSRCIPSSSDVNPVKGNSSPPRPANFSSGGAFSPPAKPAPSQPNQLKPSFQPQHGEGTYVHAPTPKKAGDANPSSNYQYHHSSQNDGLEEHNGDCGDVNKHPLIIHNHFHCNMPPFQNSHPAIFDAGPGSMGYDPNMYTFQSQFIRGTAVHHGIPSPLPFQHPPHVSVNNNHVDYGHHQQHHLPHPSASPVPPSTMSPHPYPMHSLQYQSLSPVPFSPQHVVGAVAWSGHDVHECQGHNQWGAMGNGTGWEQPTHLSSDYAFNGGMYPGSGAMGPPIMSTPTPPPMSWVPSEYGEYNGSCAAPDPTTIDEITYHNMVSNKKTSYPPQHIARENSAVPHHDKCALRDAGKITTDRPYARMTQNYEEYHVSGANRYVEGSTANKPQYQEMPRDSISYMQRPYTQNIHDSVKCRTLHEEEPSRIKLVKHGSKKHLRGSVRKRGNTSGVESNDEALKSFTKKDRLAPAAEIVSKKKNSDSKRRNKENQGQPMNVDNMKAVHGRKVKKKTEAGIKGVASEGRSVEVEKVELMDSNATRTMFKEFYRTFRLKEKTSLSCAAEFAKDYLDNASTPESMHWRIYLELADLAKRENNFNEARQLFYKVCNLQPHMSQGWLEFSKLEEECGNLDICSQLLSLGLQFCECNENLLTRAIKHEERMAHEHRNGDLSRARELLAPLKKFGIEKVWRTILEGAMMESRAGNDAIARRVLKYLMHSVAWYGPLYLEAFRLERDAGCPIKASSIVERGLKEIPQYGPLWFGAFRLYEGLDIEQNNFNLPQTMNMIERATKSISRELIWKVHLEAAQAQERAAHHFASENKDASLNEKLDLCRHSYVKTISACPEKLCWKVWLAAGRMELSACRFEEARRLFLKSFSVVPPKGRPVVLLECSRLEEFVGNVKLARAILCKSRAEAADWKVYLQSVYLEARSGNREDAIQIAQKGLKVHTGTGRLWATLVQLREADGEELQMATMQQSLTAVPKSGEVWCEAARMFLNPLSSTFDVATAVQALDFATKFTPQFGDSFLETLRLIFLQKMNKSIGLKLVNEMKKSISSIEWQSHADGHDLFFCCVGKSIQQAIIYLTTLDITFDNVDTSQLELRCSNADPNYGKLWFHCRCKPTDTARTVLRQAKELIGKDLSKYAHVYLAALMRRAAVDIMAHAKQPKSHKGINESGYKKWVEEKRKVQNSCLRTFPNIHDLITNNQDTNTYEGAQHLVSCLCSANFVTGLVALNEEKDIQSLSLIERQKVLFGNDLSILV